MNEKITLHFYLRSKNAASVGVLPLYVRLTVDGERIEFSSKKFIEKDKWSDTLSKVKGTSEEARSINNYLDSIKSQVVDIQLALAYRKEPINVENFRKMLLGKSDRDRMIITIYKEHNNRIEKVIGNGYAAGTFERFKISLKHWEEFLIWKYDLNDVAISKIDFALITDFEFYLRSVKNCSNNTAVQYVRNFRKIIKTCLSNDWLEKGHSLSMTAK